LWTALEVARISLQLAICLTLAASMSRIAHSQMGQFINAQPDTVEATAMAACLPPEFDS
jgi:hypothetical protein